MEVVDLKIPSRCALHSHFIYLSPRGEQVSILYDPGLFPAILPNGSHRNGGVPQAGNLKIHLDKFEHDVDKYIPDKNNSGLAIIDFELWRPVFLLEGVGCGSQLSSTFYKNSETRLYKTIAFNRIIK